MTITMGGRPVTLVGKPIQVGDKAPDFSAVNLDMSPFSFSGHAPDRIRIISVAPSIDTRVCALQNIRFNEEAAEMKEHAEVVMVTVDLPFAQKRYCAAETIENLTVVSDYRQREFGQRYGFLIDELMLLARGVIVIDRENTVRYVEYVSEIGNEPDYDGALATVRNLIAEHS